MVIIIPPSPPRTPRGLGRYYWAQNNFNLERSGELEVRYQLQGLFYWQPAGTRSGCRRSTEMHFKFSTNFAVHCAECVIVYLTWRYVDGESTCPRYSKHCTPDSARHWLRHFATNVSITINRHPAQQFSSSDKTFSYFLSFVQL